MSNQSKAQARAEKAAALRAAQARKERNRRFLTIGAVIAVVVVIVGGAVLYTTLSQEEIKAAPAGSSEYGLTYGETDAPHQVVIYEDFLCPHCKTMEDATSEDLAQLAGEGEVLVDYRPVAFLGDYSVRATNAFKVVLEASGGKVAKEFHDELFANQPSSADGLSDDELIDLAVEAGANEDEIRPGIEDMAQQKWVEQGSQAAEQEGVTGTPTVLLDGEPFTDGGSWSEIGDNLVAAIEE
jgi:protein-disulfide isomerase